MTKRERVNHPEVLEPHKNIPSNLKRKKKTAACGRAAMEKERTMEREKIMNMKPAERKTFLSQSHCVRKNK